MTNTKGIRLIATAVTVASLLVPGASTAATWGKIGESAEASHFIDWDSIARVGKFRKAWFKSEMATAQDTGYPVKKYNYSKTLHYFDCEAKAITAIQVLKYESGKDSVVDSWTEKFNPASLSDIVPETVGESFLKRVCGYQFGDRKP